MFGPHMELVLAPRGKVLTRHGTQCQCPTATPLNAMPDSHVLVACLCAEWCSVCRDYRGAFEQVRSRFPQARFVWIDVEDQADLVDPIEVDDFPTLLIALGTQARFFGTVTPQAETLERLVRDRTADAVGPAVTQRDVGGLVIRLRARAPLLDG